MRRHEALDSRSSPARPPLGRAVPLLALVGLALLLFCAWPAVLEHQRLARESRRLLREVREGERRLEQLHLEVRDARTTGFLREKALRRLVHAGRTYLSERNAALAR